MVSITVEDKTYTLKRRMSRYELEQVAELAKKYEKLEEKMKTDVEEAEKIVNSTTQEDQGLIDVVVSNCTGISKDTLYKETDFVHELMMFFSIIKASAPGEAHFLQLEKPSTGTISTDSKK